MRRRHPRALTNEERQLWLTIARGITPLKGRRPLSEPEPPPEPPAPPAPSREIPPQVPAPAPAPRKLPELPPLGPLDRGTRTALRRGRRAVEAVIDLHGMRQDEAHQALGAFLRRAQGSGLKLVLVVTGKGGAGSDDSHFGERGVLRRVVPHWLRLPDIRPLILGFEEAAPHHGGSGALYVRLRRSGRRERS
jgi:DNA-nicking Smr family endonuclease